MTFQKTIRRPAEIEGIGVHSGRPVHLRLLPSTSGEIVFRRTDLHGAEMGLRPDRVESRNSTALVGETFKVRTVEHLLAALGAFGVGSLIIALDADEIPIMDGSALPFVRAIERSETVDLSERGPSYRLVQSATVADGDAWVRFDPGPDDGLILEYAIVYDHPAIGTQRLRLPLTPAVFAEEIAPARTFGFLKDVEKYHRRGLALGASVGNTVVLDDAAVINPPLRFPDEFVRHKLLDLAGDLALLGRPLAGRVTASKAGHRLHLAAVRFLLDHPDHCLEG
jgi:UDP-3-O-[3-hydroxymyristoyl] N-acetylglucosamine deacetylase